MNSTLIKLYGFFAGVSLLAFLLTGQFTNAQAPAPTTLSAKDQSRAINLANNMTSRIEAMNSRLENIATRIKFTRGWMKDDWNLELPETNQKLATADQLLAENQAKVENIHQSVYAAITSTQPKNDWIGVKNEYLKMQSNLVEVHKLLTESLVSLSEAEKNWRASTTVPTLNASSTNSQ